MALVFRCLPLGLKAIWNLTTSNLYTGLSEDPTHSLCSRQNGQTACHSGAFTAKCPSFTSLLRLSLRMPPVLTWPIFPAPRSLCSAAAQMGPSLPKPADTVL